MEREKRAGYFKQDRGPYKYAKYTKMGHKIKRTKEDGKPRKLTRKISGQDNSKRTKRNGKHGNRFKEEGLRRGAKDCGLMQLTLVCVERDDCTHAFVQHAIPRVLRSVSVGGNMRQQIRHGCSRRCIPLISPRQRTRLLATAIH